MFAGKMSSILLYAVMCTKQQPIKVFISFSCNIFKQVSTFLDCCLLGYDTMYTCHGLQMHFRGNMFLPKTCNHTLEYMTS